MNALQLINRGSLKLKFYYVPSYKLDSEILLSNVLGKKKGGNFNKFDTRN